jgi:hypothetical protein
MFFSSFSVELCLKRESGKKISEKLKIFTSFYFLRVSIFTKINSLISKIYIFLSFMIKAFELTVKKGIIPVFAHQHIENSILQKVSVCKKFNDYVAKI